MGAVSGTGVGIVGAGGSVPDGVGVTGAALGAYWFAGQHPGIGVELQAVRQAAQGVTIGRPAAGGLRQGESVDKRVRCVQLVIQSGEGQYGRGQAEGASRIDGNDERARIATAVGVGGGLGAIRASLSRSWRTRKDARGSIEVPSRGQGLRYSVG